MGELGLIHPGFPKSLIHPAAQNGVFRENANSPSWKLIPPQIIEIRIQILKIFRLRRARFEHIFSARFFRNRFGILLNAAQKCAQIKPAAGEKFSNFAARFFRNRFGNLLNAAQKCTQIEPAAGEKFSNFSARFFRNRFGNLLNAAQKMCSNWARRRRKILRIWGLIFVILRGIK